MIEFFVGQRAYHFSPLCNYTLTWIDGYADTDAKKGPPPQPGGGKRYTVV